MALRRVFLGSLLGLAVVTVSLTQEDGAPKEEVTELGQWMDQMNAAFRKLRSQATLPEHNASSRERVGEMIAAAQKARELTPEKAGGMAGSDQAKFLEGYRAKMDELIDSLRKLDAAFAAGDNAAAGEMVRDLRGLQSDGHKAYKKDRK